ncbi:MAG: HAD family hydrolase [Candidatus Binatia bacterium]
MQVEGILFDYGGTLDGAASHWLDRMLALFAECAVELPLERVKSAFYRADDVAYADAAVAEMSLAELMDFHVGVQLDGLGLDDKALHQRLTDGFVARSEAALAASRAVLAELAGRYRLGVVSNFYGNVGRILADAGFAPLLAVVADSNRVGAMKPDRRIFDYALAGLGTAPAATLHVGDSYERDVCAARALGLRTAWLVPAERRPQGHDATADLVITSLDELGGALAVPMTCAPD